MIVVREVLIMNFCVDCYLQTAETIASSSQCTESETSFVDSRPVQQAASSVSSDAAPLLKSVPPQTLRSYPVYKPTNIRVNRNVDDKSRPLSYQWLIGHCAEHIHVKLSIVERYVERLELLLIVPRDLHSFREKMICTSLIRRCFKSVTKDCSTANGKHTGRRRGVLRPPPPKKLL